MSKRTQPLVSIVVPFYNLGEYVGQAIQSVIDQTYKNWEIIVVNDGSTDPLSVETIQQLPSRYKRVRIIQQSNAGLSAARNKGIGEANGEYVVCLDADDKLHPEYLEKTVLCIQEADANVAAVTTWLQEFGLRNELAKFGGYNPTKLLIENSLHVASLFKKEAWSAVGGYKPVMQGGYEDWEFWISLVEHGYAWTAVPEPLFHYRIRANSMLASIDKDLHLRLYSRIYELHKGFFKKELDDFALLSAATVKSLHRNIARTSEDIGEVRARLAEVESALRRLERNILVRSARKAKHIASRLLLLPSRLLRLIARLIARLVTKSTRLLLTKASVRLSARRVLVENKEWGKHPLVTVISPFYNQSATVGETIASVLRQTFSDFEYIIVDDGSSKSESQVLKGYFDPRIKIIRHAYNKGKGSPASARNTGIKAARGKYVVCLDADDYIDPTFLEKNLLVLESNPGISISTVSTQTFGIRKETYHYAEYNPYRLMEDNTIITSAMFRREAWEAVGGYKEGIGYEDWELWIRLAENGYFGKHTDDTLFNYREVVRSRFTEDRSRHSTNLKIIKSLHKLYKLKVFLKKLKHRRVEVATQDTWFLNTDRPEQYLQRDASKENLLILLPWMPFGGAEKLVINFGSFVKSYYNTSFVTGLESNNEWESEFKKISGEIYHLSKFYDSESAYVEFLSNYISTRHIKILHIIHTRVFFESLAELKRRHPDLKVIVTVFNNLAPHFKGALDTASSIDVFTSDNKLIADLYASSVDGHADSRVIPNGIDCVSTFNDSLYDTEIERGQLLLSKEELSVFFVGRMSEEKNPDIFVNVSKKVLAGKHKNKFKFFMIGDGDMKEKVERSIASLGSDRITHMGYQSDMPRLLSAADVLVLPSSAEGFPTSVLEAMATKTVVIASKVGAIPDVIEDGVDGFIVENDKRTMVDEIVSTLERIATSGQDMDRLKEAAKNKVHQQYSVEQLGKNYKDLYDSLA